MIIQIKNFTKKFGHKTVFNYFNLEIAAGEMVALTGPSGSGKTTLLNTIGLIDVIETGEYTLFGKMVPKVNSKAASKIIREKISYLFQNFALVDNFTVVQNLMMALKYVKKSKQEKAQLIENALEQVGLKGYDKFKVFEISGGEAQRVAIARAVLKPSEIILADEPTGSLDSQNRDEVLEILCQLNKSGKTIIVVTHDNTVANRCERVVNLA